MNINYELLTPLQCLLIQRQNTLFNFANMTLVLKHKNCGSACHTMYICDTYHKQTNKVINIEQLNFQIKTLLPHNNELYPCLKKQNGL